MILNEQQNDLFSIPFHEWIPCGGAQTTSEQQSCLLEAVDVLYFDINKVADIDSNDFLINNVGKHRSDRTTFGNSTKNMIVEFSGGKQF